MGSRLIKFYRDDIKRSWKIAFFSSFGIGLLVHIFKFVNVIPNADALMNFYNSQNMVASGRWLLGLVCSLSTSFDLPWVTGILSLFFAGVTAAVIAEHFRMENPCLIVLSSGLLVSFPAISFTFAYGFTADGYMIAMLLAALSALLSRMENIRRDRWKQLVLSGVCICLCCGIYQAYISFAFALAVCYIILELLEGRYPVRKILCWICVQILIYGCALAAYYGIWKLSMVLQGVQASSYLGIDSLALGDGGIISAVYRIVRDFYVFFFQWNIFEHGITVYSALNILFMVALAIGLIIALVKSGAYKSKASVALLVLCLVSLPFGCFLWHFTSSDVYYHAVMLQSLCILYIFAAVLYERWTTLRKADLMMILLSAIIFNNSLSANLFYVQMHMTYERTYSKATEIVTRIHQLDDGTVRYIAFGGKANTWDPSDQFDPGVLRNIGGNRFIQNDLTSYQFLMLYMDLDLAYYKINGEEYPVMELYPGAPVPYDHQFLFPALPIAERDALVETQEYSEMPVWPAEGSVKRIGDTIVVKLSE